MDKAKALRELAARSANDLFQAYLMAWDEPMTSDEIYEYLSIIEKRLRELNGEDDEEPAKYPGKGGE